MVPSIIDLQHMQQRQHTVIDLQHMQQRQHTGSAKQIASCGLRHAVLTQLDTVVFSSFRASHILVANNTGLFDSGSDQEAVVLQLQLESKRALAMLQAVNTASSHSADAASPQGGSLDALLGHYADQFMTNMLCNKRLLQWNLNLDPTPFLSPAAKTLVAAALKVQIIASAMHTQLIRVVVPGWLQDTCVRTNPAAPAAWAQWPGVLPLTKSWMQAGAALTAASGSLLPGIEAAAVFCQEPAVVQVAERVGDLPDFGGKTAQQGVYKVLVKARMGVAR